jgi:hypothetical protein
MHREQGEQGLCRRANGHSRVCHQAATGDNVDARVAFCARRYAEDGAPHVQRAHAIGTFTSEAVARRTCTPLRLSAPPTPSLLPVQLPRASQKRWCGLTAIFMEFCPTLC